MKYVYHYELYGNNSHEVYDQISIEYEIHHDSIFLSEGTQIRLQNNLSLNERLKKVNKYMEEL